MQVDLDFFSFSLSTQLIRYDDDGDDVADVCTCSFYMKLRCMIWPNQTEPTNNNAEKRKSSNREVLLFIFSATTANNSPDVH